MNTYYIFIVQTYIDEAKDIGRDRKTKYCRQKERDRNVKNPAYKGADWTEPNVDQKWR